MYNLFNKEKDMRKKNNELISAIKNDIFNNTKTYIIVIGIFVLGILFGVIFINQADNKAACGKRHRNTPDRP